MARRRIRAWRWLSIVWLIGLVSQAVEAAAVTIVWTAVGDPGNPADASGFGSVGTAYRIGSTEVTNAQYAEFLGAVASSADLVNGADPNGLYSGEMDTSPHGGISRSGDGLVTDFAYTVKPGFADKPVSFTSFWDALRFANWLHNGQPSGAQDASTTEDGAYTLTEAAVNDNSVVRNAGASIFLPSEDEWYKAAYYDALSTSYLDYPAGSNAATICTAPTGAANSANCDAPGTDASDPDVDGLTDVGSFTGSASPYGTSDQGGNVWEWNEAIVSGAFRGLRGGSADSAQSSLAAATRASTVPTAENAFFGFRVASPIPEPGSGALLMLGLMGLAHRPRRRTRSGRARRRRATATLLALAVTPPLLATAPGSATAQDAGCEIVEAGAALTPGQLARMIELRQRFFGAAYVDPATGALDPDVVIASWAAVTSYALAIGGHVLQLDAYLGDDSGYVPTHDCELSGLRPDFVFVGHGHFDHAELVPTLLNRNRGAVFIGAAEHCLDATTALDGFFAPDCVEASPRGAPFGTTLELRAVIPGVEMSAVRHPHGGAESADSEDPSTWVLDLEAAEPKPAGWGPCPVCPRRPNFVEPVYVEDGAISVLYQFRIGEFALTWNNTVGRVRDGIPVELAIRALPQTDVQLGAVVTLNAVNGGRDPRLMAEALRTRLIVPIHHDFAIPFSGGIYRTAFHSEMEETPEASRPGILWVEDPDDYVRPERLTWFVDDPIWSGSEPVIP